MSISGAPDPRSDGPHASGAEAICADVERLFADGGDGNRLVLQAGPAWFVLAAERGGRAVTVEAAPSAALPAPLTLDQVQALRAAGFGSRPGRRALARHVAVDLPGAIPGLVDELLRLFREVYALGPEQAPTRALTLGPRERADNPRLIQAMRGLAGKRDLHARHAVYGALLDATLLLAVDAAGEPVAVGDLEGWDVYGCFSGWDQLSLFDPRGIPYTALRGRELVLRLLERPRAGSLLINPRGDVGGELYRNELHTLQDAIYRRTGR